MSFSEYRFFPFMIDVGHTNRILVYNTNVDMHLSTFKSSKRTKQGRDVYS